MAAVIVVMPVVVRRGRDHERGRDRAYGRDRASDRLRGGDRATGSTPGATATSDAGCGSSNLAEEQHHRRAGQREQRDQPNQVEKVHMSHHFNRSISSACTVSLLRNSAIRMPSPTAASATASVMTKIAKICPLHAAQGLREGDQIDVHRIQDQLDRHQDDHDIAPGQHPDGADQQQRRAQGQVMYRRHGCIVQILFFAITTEPTTATSSSTLAISNGSRYSLNSTSATCSHVAAAVAAADRRGIRRAERARALVQEPAQLRADDAHRRQRRPATAG